MTFRLRRMVTAWTLLPFWVLACQRQQQRQKAMGTATSGSPASTRLEEERSSDVAQQKPNEGQPGGREASLRCSQSCQVVREVQRHLGTTADAMLCQTERRKAAHELQQLQPKGLRRCVTQELKHLLRFFPQSPTSETNAGADPPGHLADVRWSNPSTVPMHSSP